MGASLYKKYRTFFIILFLFLISVAIRIKSLNNSFVLDDYRLIIDNSFIHSIGNFFKIINPVNFFDVLPVICGARPLTVVSLMFDYFIFGQNPAGYHFVNLILHGFNVVLLFLFVRNLFGSRFAGVISALFFSLHPIQSEVINVASFRADLLCAFFTLIFLNLIILLKNCEKNKRNIILILMFLIFACALFSKENAIIIPFLLSGYVIFFNKESQMKKLFSATAITALIFFFFFWIERFPVPLYNIIYPGIENNTAPLNDPGTYISVITASFYHNFMHIIYPVNLSVDYFVNYSKSMPFYALFTLFAVAACIISFLKIKNKYFKFALFFTAVSYIPVSNIIPLVNTIADRYMYMPMIGISMIFAYLILKSFKVVNSKMAYAFFIFLFLIYSFISYQRGLVYANQYTLYKDAVLKNPQNVRTSYNMAVAYIANQEYENAIKQFDNVVKINPLYRRDQVWFLSGLSYESLGERDLARKYYHKAFLLNNSDKNVIKKFTESFGNIQEAKQYLFSNTFKLDKQAFFNFEENTKNN